MQRLRGRAPSHRNVLGPCLPGVPRGLEVLSYHPTSPRMFICHLCQSIEKAASVTV